MARFGRSFPQSTQIFRLPREPIFVDLVGNASNGVSSLSGGLVGSLSLAAVSNGVSTLSTGADQPNVALTFAAVTNGVSTLSAETLSFLVLLAGITNGVSRMSGQGERTVDLGGPIPIPRPVSITV